MIRACLSGFWGVMFLVEQNKTKLLKRIACGACGLLLAFVVGVGFFVHPTENVYASSDPLEFVDYGCLNGYFTTYNNDEWYFTKYFSYQDFNVSILSVGIDLPYTGYMVNYAEFSFAPFVNYGELLNLSMKFEFFNFDSPMVLWFSLGGSCTVRQGNRIRTYNFADFNPDEGYFAYNNVMPDTIISFDLDALLQPCLYADGFDLYNALDNPIYICFDLFDVWINNLTKNGDPTMDITLIYKHNYKAVNFYRYIQDLNDLLALKEITISTPVDVIVEGASGILGIEILPNLSFYSILLLALAIPMTLWIVKWFLGG